MNKHEVKFYNTAERIHGAFIELLETKVFSDISVSEICNKANIHRSTFYAHYNNTVELAAELEHSLMIHFYQNNETLTKALKNNDLPLLKGDMLSFKPMISEVLEYVKGYKRLFVLYDEGLFFKKNEYTQIIKDLLVIPVFRAKGINDRMVIEYMADFYLTGINAVISKWVKDDCKIPIEEICEIAEKCFNFTLISQAY